MSNRPEESPRISLADAIRLMEGVVTRTEFYEKYRHDADVIEQLDIRRNPRKERGLHCSREAVLRWIAEQIAGHPPAIGNEKNSRHLRRHTEAPTADNAERLEGALYALNRALERGVISQEAFDQAVRDLLRGKDP